MPTIFRKIPTVPTLGSLLLAFIGLLCVGEAWTQGPGYNEFGRLASGLFYLKSGDFSPFHVNKKMFTLSHFGLDEPDFGEGRVNRLRIIMSLLGGLLIVSALYKIYQSRKRRGS